MYAVIFRATIKQPDEHYTETAAGVLILGGFLLLILGRYYFVQRTQYITGN